MAGWAHISISQSGDSSDDEAEAGVASASGASATSASTTAATATAATSATDITSGTAVQAGGTFSSRWLNNMLESTQHMRARLGKQIREIKLISACSGMLTELHTLQLLGLQATVEAAAEKKVSAQHFVMQNTWKPKHLYEDLADLRMGGGACVCHGGQWCDMVPTKRDTDMFVMGCPCQPYSRQRPKRFKGTVDHHAAGMSREFIDLVARMEPKVAIMEEVQGFNAPESSENPSTPFDEWAALVQESLPSYSLAKILVNAATWLPVHRTRYLNMTRKHVVHGNSKGKRHTSHISATRRG